MVTRRLQDCGIRAFRSPVHDPSFAASEIFVINPDGTGEERRTFHADQDSDLDWSSGRIEITWGNL